MALRRNVSAVAHWFRELGTHFDPQDFLYLTPPGFAAAFAKYLVAPDRHLPAEELDARDVEYIRVWMDGVRAIGKHYFRWKVSGLQHVPTEGPVLFVGSHNGVLMVSDSALTMLALWDHFGPERRLYSLSHDVLQSNETFRKHVKRLGILRAGHSGAERALREGHMVLVYPGSDLDSARPFKDRYKIVLGGRKGFLKLALRTQVPIVPVVSVGTHEQLIVLTRGDRLAEKLRIKQLLRIEAFPIVLALPWGITSGFLPYFPLPAQTSVAFGPALRFTDVSPSQAEDPETLQNCYEKVEQALQLELDRLAKGRIPFIG